MKNVRAWLISFYQRRESYVQAFRIWWKYQRERSLIEWFSLLRQAVIDYVIWVVPSVFLLSVGNILFQLIYRLPFVNRQRKRFEKELKPILYFRSYWTIVWMGLAGTVLAILVTNYLVVLFQGCMYFLYHVLAQVFQKEPASSLSFPTEALDWLNLWNLSVFFSAPILAFPLFILLEVIVWKSAWINFEQYRNYNNQEEGDDRFALSKEIKKQYKKIPDKNEEYEGHGGIPIFHETKKNLTGRSLTSQMMWRNEYFSRYVTHAQRVLGLAKMTPGYFYIEDDTTNVVGIGSTRSSKGEGFIFNTVDINSRAKIKPSMLIGDPKGEIYQSSYKTLRRRGYDVEVLNYLNMDMSMSSNPLYLAIQAAKKGYYEKTQQRVNAVAEAIYRKTPPGKGNGNAKYFEDSSISLFNAIALALIDRANETQEEEKDAWDTVTVRNIAKFLTALGSETVYVDEIGQVVEQVEEGQRVESESKITTYFMNLRRINQVTFSKFREMADLAFSASNFAAEETKGNVYSSMMSGLNLFLQDDVAKLTSKNSIDLESIGFPRRLSIKFRSSTNVSLRNEFAHQTAKVTITGKDETVYVKEATALVDGEGYLTYAIEPKLPDEFTIFIDFNHKNNEDDVILSQNFTIEAKKVYQKKGLRKVIDIYTREPILSYIEVSIRNKQEGQLLEATDVELIYSDKPKAVFIVTPPNRSEYNELVSLFLDQVFNANYELALLSGRKCINRILHILDEFANLPMVRTMNTKISIGLGQGILYHLWLQNLEQLDEKYGKEVAATILDNCSIQIYIKSLSPTTNEKYSKALGTKTITKRSRSMNMLDEANPNVRVENPSQPLMSPTQISKLQAGEAIIFRGVKLFDRTGRKVTTDPIFMTGKHTIPYRYMFLTEEFDSSQTLADIPVESPHRYLDLQEIAVEPNRNFINLMDWKKRLLSQAEVNPRLRGRQSSPRQFYESPEEQIESIAQSILSLDDELDIEDVI